MTAETALILAFTFGGDAAAPTAPAAPAVPTKIVAPAAPPQPKTQVVAHVYSTSHTHACPNSNCPFRRAYGEPYVWNHATDGGTHLCAYCGTEQKIVSNRPVTILRRQQIPATAPAAQRPAPSIVSFAMPRETSNCPPAG